MAAVSMAETRTLQLKPDSTHNLSLFSTLDPTSLILSQYSSNSIMPNTLQLTTDSYFMERGPRYNAYARIRESNIRRKRVLLQQPTEEEEEELSEIPKLESTPPIKKSVKFQGSFSASKRSGSSVSVLAQSVPDFSSALRKENRRPPPVNRVEVSATPPPVSKSGKMYGGVGKFGGGGSRSVNSGEKRSGGLMARKSYASVEELKGLSAATANAIGGENRIGGGRSRMVTRKSTVLGYRYN